MSVLAFVDDLMDRSRISAAIPDVVFTRASDAGPDASVVFIDLGRYGDAVDAIRQAHPEAQLVAFGSHVDRDAFAAARAVGADTVVARSEFFRDPSAYTSGQGYDR